MRTWRFFYFFSCMAIYSSFVSANQWRATDGTLHGSAMSACLATSNPDLEIRILSISLLSSGEYRATCSYKTGNISSYQVRTTQDQCPAGTTPLTPTLENSALCTDPPNPCESRAGSTSSFFATVPGGGTSLPGEYVCSDACRATWSGQCGANSDGVSACWGLATFTGSGCQSGDTPTGIGSPPVTPPPDPTDPSNNCPPGYGWSGTTCVQNPPDPDDPPPTDPGDGGDNEGGDNGGNEDGGDGNNGGGNGGNNDGGDGSGDGSGNGSGDGDTGGDGNGSGTGNGNGDGDGDKEEGEEEEEKEPSVGGESCTAELECEGDAIQCAILRKNKEQLCQWKYDEGVRGSIAAELSGPDYQLEEKSVGVGSLFNDALNKGRWLPSACPAPESFNVMGRSYSFSWEPVCRFATAMGPLLVALASIFFAVSIGRALKGS